MGPLFLVSVFVPGAVERLLVDVLCMRRNVVTHTLGQITSALVWHRRLLADWKVVAPYPAPSFQANDVPRLASLRVGQPCPRDGDNITRVSVQQSRHSDLGCSPRSTRMPIRCRALQCRLHGFTRN